MGEGEGEQEKLEKKMGEGIVRYFPLPSPTPAMEAMYAGIQSAVI